MWKRGPGANATATGPHSSGIGCRGAWGSGARKCSAKMWLQAAGGARLWCQRVGQIFCQRSSLFPPPKFALESIPVRGRVQRLMVPLPQALWLTHQRLALRCRSSSRRRAHFSGGHGSMPVNTALPGAHAPRDPRQRDHERSGWSKAAQEPPPSSTEMPIWMEILLPVLTSAHLGRRPRRRRGRRPAYTPPRGAGSAFDKLRANLGAARHPVQRLAARTRRAARP